MKVELSGKYAFVPFDVTGFYYSGVAKSPDSISLLRVGPGLWVEQSVDFGVEKIESEIDAPVYRPISRKFLEKSRGRTVVEFVGLDAPVSLKINLGDGTVTRTSMEAGLSDTLRFDRLERKAVGFETVKKIKGNFFEISRDSDVKGGESTSSWIYNDKISKIKYRAEESQEGDPSLRWFTIYYGTEKVTPFPWGIAVNINSLKVSERIPLYKIKESKPPLVRWNPASFYMEDSVNRIMWLEYSESEGVLSGAFSVSEGKLQYKPYLIGSAVESWQITSANGDVFEAISPDKSRTVRLDMETGQVEFFYASGVIASRGWLTNFVERGDALPSLGLCEVNELKISSGKKGDTIIKVSQDSWELRRSGFSNITFQEIARTGHTIALGRELCTRKIEKTDLAQRNLLQWDWEVLEVDLDAKSVKSSSWSGRFESVAKNQLKLLEIPQRDSHTWSVDVQTAIDGYLVNRVDLANLRLVQSGWTDWTEFDAKGNPSFFFSEIGRSANYIDLLDQSRNMRLRIDLVKNKLRFAFANQDFRDLYDIVALTQDHEYWRDYNPISARCSLTEDLFPVDDNHAQLYDSLAKNPSATLDSNTADQVVYGTTKPAGAPSPVLHASVSGSRRFWSRTVYRTSVDLPKHVTWVEVMTSEELNAIIDDKPYSLGPDKAVRILPNHFGKLSISIQPDIGGENSAIGCATISLRTNLMRQDEWHDIMPDTELHDKLMGLTEDQLIEHKNSIGLGDRSNDEVKSLHKMIRNIAGTAYDTHNITGHGLEHARSINSLNMEDEHFVFHFDHPELGGLHYEALTSEQARAQIGTLNPKTQDICCSNFFERAVNAVGSGFKIVVHTVETGVVHGFNALEHAGEAAIDTVGHLVADVAHGDFKHIGKDLLNGANSVSKALEQGVLKVVSDTLSGAAKLVTVVVETTAGAIQFVLNHTGIVGQLLGKILDAVGSIAGKFLRFILDKLGWGDVLETQRHIQSALLDGIDSLKDAVQSNSTKTSQRAKITESFTSVRAEFNDAINSVEKTMGVYSASAVNGTVPGHNNAMEKLEWIMGKLIPQPAIGAAATDVVIDVIEFSLPNPDQKQKALEADVKSLISSIGAMQKQISDDCKDLSHLPQRLARTLFELLRKFGHVAFEAMDLILEELLNGLSGSLDLLRKVLTAEIDIHEITPFYKALTDSSLTIANLISLVVAIPTTILSKAILGRNPFPSVQQSSGLSAEVGGLIYAVTHLVLAALAPICSALNPKAPKADPRIVKDIPTTSLIGFLGLGATTLAFVFGAPGAPGELGKPAHTDDLSDTDKHIAQAQNAVFGFQIVELILAVGTYFNEGEGAQKFASLRKIPEVAVTIAGIGHFISAIVLLARERNKGDLLINSALQSEQKDYISYACTGGAELKFGANMFDSIPSLLNIIKIFPPMEEVFAVYDNGSHFAQAVTVIGRVGNGQIKY